MLAGFGITLAVEGIVAGRVVELPVVGNCVVDEFVFGAAVVSFGVLVKLPSAGSKNKYLST